MPNPVAVLELARQSPLEIESGLHNDALVYAYYALYLLTEKEHCLYDETIKTLFMQKEIAFSDNGVDRGLIKGRCSKFTQLSDCCHETADNDYDLRILHCNLALDHLCEEIENRCFAEKKWVVDPNDYFDARFCLFLLEHNYHRNFKSFPPRLAWLLYYALEQGCGGLDCRDYEIVYNAVFLSLFSKNGMTSLMVSYKPQQLQIVMGGSPRPMFRATLRFGTFSNFLLAGTDAQLKQLKLRLQQFIENTRLKTTTAETSFAELRTIILDMAATHGTIGRGGLGFSRTPITLNPLERIVAMRTLFWCPVSVEKGTVVFSNKITSVDAAIAFYVLTNDTMLRDAMCMMCDAYLLCNSLPRKEGTDKFKLWFC